MVKSTVATAQRAADRNPVSQAGAKVTVALKMPSALRLRIFDMRPSTEQVMGGGVRETKIAHFAGEIYVNGNSKRVEDQFGCEVVAGFALTRNVPKDFWERWFEDNKDGLLVTNGLIFAHENHDRVVAEAKEKRNVRSNLEPMDQNPADDPRTPKGQIEIEHGER